jgi:hypothetical protein
MASTLWCVYAAIDSLLRDAAEDGDCGKVRALAALRAQVEAEQVELSPDASGADLYAVVRREMGPWRTFLTLSDAQAELEAVLACEPERAGDMWIEPFRVRVVASERRHGAERRPRWHRRA